MNMKSDDLWIVSLKLAISIYDQKKELKENKPQEGGEELKVNGWVWMTDGIDTVFRLADLIFSYLSKKMKERN